MVYEDGCHEEISNNNQTTDPASVACQVTKFIEICLQNHWLPVFMQRDFMLCESPCINDVHSQGGNAFLETRNLASSEITF